MCYCNTFSDRGWNANLSIDTLDNVPLRYSCPRMAAVLIHCFGNQTFPLWRWQHLHNQRLPRKLFDCPQSIEWGSRENNTVPFVILRLLSVMLSSQGLNKPLLKFCLRLRTQHICCTYNGHTLHFLKKLQHCRTEPIVVKIITNLFTKRYQVKHPCYHTFINNLYKGSKSVNELFLRIVKQCVQGVNCEHYCLAMDLIKSCLESQTYVQATISLVEVEPGENIEFM